MALSKWGWAVREDLPLADGFVICCPVSAAGNSPVREIRKRGNIPLVLQEELVVELTRNDMMESWRTTRGLGRKRSQQLLEMAALRISTVLQDNDSCEMPRLAGDVTAFFLLALHEKGLDVNHASRFCQMAWNGRSENHLSVAEY